ncbi:MAG: phosphoribosylformylglycinamidine synthase subunit PurS [Bacteroidia bacterium]|nr:phosphoribosylformylglycinamidine synthase subunit PurS [Bacteroidia bacterium]
MPKYQLLITVLPRPALLDPEGETIRQAIHRLGYDTVIQVRAGRAFYVEVEASTPEEAVQQGKALAENFLHNPVVEVYHVHPPALVISPPPL